MNRLFTRVWKFALGGVVASLIAGAVLAFASLSAFAATLDNFKARGVDVSPLQTALDNFKNTLPAATQVNATASAILSAHNGFDAGGGVTDQAAARTTVQSAGESLHEVHQILSAAIGDLRSEVKIFRQQHKVKKPAATPTATPGSSS